MKKTSIKKELRDNKLTYLKKMKQFRFLSYLFVAVLCLGFVSCSDDDDFEENDIIGSWSIIEVYEKWNEDGDEDEDTDIYGEGKWIYTFNNDGTGTEVEYDGNYTYRDNFTWSLKSGNKLTLTFTEGSDTNSFTFTIRSLNKNGAVIDMSGKDEYYSYFYQKRTLKKYTGTVD